MTEPLPAQFAEKHSIIKSLFVNTADDNYVAARMCFHLNLDIDFFWLAVHCLEKYLKAVLLHNGRSARNYGHNIIKLYETVHPLAPELLPENLLRPEGMPAELWREELTTTFIERLYRDGQADNRYQLFGYVRHAEDLWKLDQVVFNVRRLCQPLEVHFLLGAKPAVPDESKRERMSKDPASWKLYGTLEDTIAGKHGETLQRALLDWNRPFAPRDWPQPQMDYRYSSRESVLIRRLLDPLETGRSSYAQADELWLWVKANIKLSKDFIEKIEKHRDTQKAKHDQSG